MKAPPGKPARWLYRYFAAAALAYAAFGVVAAAWLAPRVPYADAWRHYARLLQQPFPASVLAVDNGHAEIVANLVRLIDLRQFAGTEYLQIAVALLLALATAVVLLRVVLRASDIDPAARAAAAFALTLGLFWLANERALAHANDGLHVYCVLLALAATIALLVRAALTPARVAGASACCLFAALNFGSGIASFAALGALLFVRRAERRHYLIVGGMLPITLALYAWLKNAQAIPIAWRPGEQVAYALSQLAAPLQYLLWPWVDPVAAAQVPAPFGALALASADAWQRAFGDVHTSVLPQSIGGALLVAMLLFLSWQARRAVRAAEEIVRLGLALGWFGVGVSGVIALSRVDYFAQYPTQLYAPRYLPWSTLAWSGCLIALIGFARTRRLASGIALAVSVLALPAEFGMLRIMHHQREIADDVALAAAVGVWPDSGGPGEVDPADTRAGAQAMRQYATGPFAWPEAAWIGKSIALDAAPVAALSSATSPVDNGINTDAQRVVAVLVVPPACVRPRLLLADRGRIVGLLRPLGGQRWRGAALAPANTPLQIFAPACQ